MADARNKFRVVEHVAGSPDEVFSFLTDHFLELWPGRNERTKDGEDPAEPNGLGSERLMRPPAAQPLNERITAHERPRLIEYVVIDEDAQISNHLGRVEIEPEGDGSRVVYTVTFDLRPAFAGPVAVGVMKAAWNLRAGKRLRARFA